MDQKCTVFKYVIDDQLQYFLGINEVWRENRGKQNPDGSNTGCQFYDLLGHRP